MLHCTHFDVKGGNRTFAERRTKVRNTDKADLNEPPPALVTSGVAEQT
ncbi:MAG: hypothetical protein V3U96_04200 [Paracoccaceae bacterium]